MSQQSTHETQSLEKFRELMREFDNAMLVSLDSEGLLHGRPMRIVAQAREHPDDLWFFTELASEKIAEIQKQPGIAVILADGKRFLSISGMARVDTEPAKITALWQESWRPWFPNGPNSGNIALIQVRPFRAEYWDQSVINGLRFAFAAAKAYVGRHKIDEPNGPEQHAKVDLG